MPWYTVILRFPHRNLLGPFPYRALAASLWGARHLALRWDGTFYGRIIFRDRGLILDTGILRFDLGRLKSDRVCMPMICRRESAGSILCLDPNRFCAVRQITLSALEILGG